MSTAATSAGHLGVLSRQEHASEQETWHAWAGRARTVETRRDLSRDEFIREYVRRERPVVIKDVVPADAVTPDVLRLRCGHRPVDQLAGGGGAGVLVRGSAAGIELFKALGTLGAYLQCFEDPAADLPYLTNLNVAVNFPEVEAAFTPPAYFQPNWITRRPFSAFGFEATNRIGAEVFIAPLGMTYGVLHYDQHRVFVGTCQYYGRKMWWLAPPECSPFLYPRDGGSRHTSRIRNPFEPDLAEFPLLERVHPYIVTLEPGDIMFVPSSWWHMTRAVTPNISSVHRIINRYNVMAHLWDLKYYALHDRRMMAVAFQRLLPRRRA